MFFDFQYLGDDDDDDDDDAPMSLKMMVMDDLILGDPSAHSPP